MQFRILSACLFWVIGPAFAEPFESKWADDIEKPERFAVCSNHGCRKMTTIYAFHQEWKLVRALFQQETIETAAEERQVIAEAIGLIESLVGPLAGTLNDKGGNSFFTTEGRTDCVDESMNTTRYLKMMVRDKLIQFHTVQERVYRFFPHWTAVIAEKTTDQKYAVDSWFYDNGVPPVILLLEWWQKGQGGQKGDYHAPLKITRDDFYSTAYAQVTYREPTEINEH